MQYAKSDFISPSTRGCLALSRPSCRITRPHPSTHSPQLTAVSPSSPTPTPSAQVNCCPRRARRHLSNSAMHRPPAFIPFAPAAAPALSSPFVRAAAPSAPPRLPGAARARVAPARRVASRVVATGAPLEVTQDNFDDEVLKSDIPVLVDFYAPWCGPCRLVAPLYVSPFPCVLRRVAPVSRCAFRVSPLSFSPFFCVTFIARVPFFGFGRWRSF